MREIRSFTSQLSIGEGNTGLCLLQRCQITMQSRIWSQDFVLMILCRALTANRNRDNNSRMHAMARFRTVKTASAFLIAAMLAFTIVMVPEHAAALVSHESCHTCSIIHHPPILQAADLAPIGLTLQRGLLSPMTAQHALAEPTIGLAPSRAPPSLT